MTPMCSSAPEKIPLVMAEAVRLAPASVLDVGMGFGKYGLLLREYADIGLRTDEPAHERGRWRLRLTGVEVFAPFVLAHQRAIYDDILVGDIRELLRVGRVWPHDLALMVEVLEHMPKADGFDVLRRLSALSRAVLVTTPNGFQPMPELLGNPFQEHVSGWLADDLRDAGFSVLREEGFLMAVCEKEG